MILRPFRHFALLLLLSFLCASVSLRAHTNQYTITIPSGFSMVANQLNHGGNTVLELFGANLPDGTLLYTFDARRQIHKVNQFQFDRWTRPNDTIQPGQGVLIRNPAGAASLTFTGTEPSPEFPELLGGYNYVSFPSRLEQRLPQPLSGDEIILWRSTNQFVHVWNAATAAWSPEVPRIGPGEGFIYRRAEPLSPEAVTNGTIYLSSRIAGLVDAPAQAPRGEPLSSGWRAELAIITGATVQVLTPNVPFAKGLPMSYYVDPALVEARGYAPGQTITVMLRAYKGYDFYTAPNRGYSSPFTITLGGGGLLPPANLENLRGFTPYYLTFTFLEHPQSETVSPGSDVRFFVETLRTDLKYQWRKDGGDIPGATNALLVLTNVGLADTGVYSVFIPDPPSGPPWVQRESASATLSLFDINAVGGLTIAGSAGTRYLVEYASQLDANDWTKLTEIILPTNPYTFTDATAPTDRKRFYRAVAVPNPM